MASVGQETEAQEFQPVEALPKLRFKLQFHAAWNPRKAKNLIWT